MSNNANAMFSSQFGLCIESIKGSAWPRGEWWIWSRKEVADRGPAIGFVMRRSHPTPEQLPEHSAQGVSINGRHRWPTYSRDRCSYV